MSWGSSFDKSTDGKHTDRGTDSPAPSGNEPGKLQLTTLRQMLVAGLCGFGIGWVLVATLEVFGQVTPLTPWSLLLVLGLVALGALVYAPWLKHRLRIDRSLVDHQEALIALVVGKMMALTGMVVGGAHLSYALLNLPRLEAALPMARLIRGLICVAVCLVFTFAGARLERVCLAKGGDDDDSDEPKSGQAMLAGGQDF